jgi:hypothetical protein
MIYDQAMMTFMYYFLFGGVAIVEAGLLVLSWWCLYYYKE